MELPGPRFFAAVARIGRFTRVAAAFHVAQPADYQAGGWEDLCRPSAPRTGPTAEAGKGSDQSALANGRKVWTISPTLPA